MNVREEDRQKNSCPSRGLGLAAAAIGVGVGAALYYFFSKRPENPDGEGSTTNWSTEQPHTFSTSTERNSDADDDNSSDSYTTVSEHSTTDTSMEVEPLNDSHEMIHSLSESLEDNEASDFEDSESEIESNESMQYDCMSNVNETESSIEQTSPELSFATEINESVQFDLDIGNDWDVTNSSLDLPSVHRPHSPSAEQLLSQFTNMLLRRYTSPRSDRTRDRSWSLEECSICFDVILKDHKVTTLPCTHHFHAECITPWLQEQQTCPNCRKAAE